MKREISVKLLFVFYQLDKNTALFRKSGKIFRAKGNYSLKKTLVIRKRNGLYQINIRSKSVFYDITEMGLTSNPNPLYEYSLAHQAVHTTV